MTPTARTAIPDALLAEVTAALRAAATSAALRADALLGEATAARFAADAARKRSNAVDAVALSDGNSARAKRARAALRRANRDAANADRRAEILDADGAELLANADTLSHLARRIDAERRDAYALSLCKRTA